MFKKVILVSSILAISTSLATANTAPYIGASTGITTNTNWMANSRGAPFNVFVGYGGIVTQSIYLAGEVIGTLWTAQLADHYMQSSYGYGASIIPGLMLSNHTMAFGRLGAVRTHFTFNGTGMSTGGQAGLGLQTTLTQNVDLRGEYDYTAYNTVNGLSSPRADAFSVGLIYKFD